jgi:hypothetical protein
MRGGLPPEIIDVMSEFQTADDQGIPNSILCSELCDEYGRPAYKQIRRMLPFTTFWGVEAYAHEDSAGMYVDLLLNHRHPYFTRIMMRAQVVLEWHITVKYLPIKSRVRACKKDRVLLKSRSDIRGTWYLMKDVHAVFRKVLYHTEGTLDVVNGDEF